MKSILVLLMLLVVACLGGCSFSTVTEEYDRTPQAAWSIGSGTVDQKHRRTKPAPFVPAADLSKKERTSRP